MTAWDTLREIRTADPDGWDIEPTDADRARFKAWVCLRYGVAVWVAYATENWDDVNRVDLY